MKLSLALFLFLPSLAFAKAQFTILRGTELAGVTSVEGIFLSCPFEKSKGQKCHVSRMKNGKIEKTVTMEAAQALTLLEGGVKDLAIYNGVDQSKTPLFSWSIELGAKSFKGGTDTKNPADRNKLLARLMLIEMSLNQELMK